MKKEIVCSVIITVLYAIVTLIAVINHEIWADEAQVWMLCKHLSIPQLINHLHNEGHPSLMYLITMPFAKIFSNILYMQIICWLAMCFSVFLLMHKSKFPFYVKLAIISSGGFLYFLPVMARSYAIIPALIFISAIFYSKRRENPILYAIPLFLLANTHAIMFGFVSILTFLFIYETLKEKEFYRTRLISIILILLGLTLVVLQLHNTTSENYYITYKPNYFLLNIIKVPVFFFLSAFNYEITINKALLFPILDVFTFISLLTIFIVLFINLFINNRKIFLIGTIGIIFQFCIYIFTYSANIYVNKIFITFSILIFCFWILYEDNSFKNNSILGNRKISSILLCVFFFLTCYNGINYYILDYKYNYAGAKETAAFIKDNLNKNSKFLIDNESYMISLSYYLQDKYNIFSVIRNKKLKYIIWDEINSQRLSNIAWYKYTKILANEGIQDIYIVRSYADENNKNISKKLEEEYKDNFKLIFCSSPSVEKNEGYKIYKYTNRN